MAQKNFVGRGVSFPFSFDPRSGGVAKDQGQGANQQVQRINEALEQVLGIKKGEVFMRRKRGSRLRSMIFQLNTNNLRDRLQFVIVDAIESRDGFGEPRISIDETKATLEARNPQAILEMAYTIRQTNTEGNFVYPYYLGGSERDAAERGLTES